MRHARDRRRGQAGLATVWALAWIAVAATFAWGVLLLAAAVSAQHHVEGAADLVAVSAATDLAAGGDACAAAARVAGRNDVALIRCDVTLGRVAIEVGDDFAFPLGIGLTLRGVALAGPG